MSILFPQGPVFLCEVYFSTRQLLKSKTKINLETVHQITVSQNVISGLSKTMEHVESYFSC